jgi:hypothetical protein
MFSETIASLRSHLENSVEAFGGEDVVEEICTRMYTSMFVGSGPMRADSIFSDFDDYYGLDDEDYEFIMNNKPQFSLSNLTPDTMIVAIVNYKGELECYAKVEDTKNLPKFISKDESFFQMVQHD